MNFSKAINILLIDGLISIPFLIFLLYKYTATNDVLLVIFLFYTAFSRVLTLQIGKELNRF